MQFSKPALRPQYGKGFWRTTILWLLLPGFRLSWSYKIDIDKFPTDISEFKMIVGKYTGRRPIDLQLSKQIVLTKHHKLPRKARSQSTKVMKLRADALATASTDALVSNYVRLESGSGFDNYVQVFTHQSGISKLASFADETGIALRKIEHSHDGNQIILYRHSEKGDRAIYTWWYLTLVIACVFSLASLAQAKRTNHDLNERLAETEATIADTRQTIENNRNVQLSRSTTTASELNAIEQISHGQTAIHILNALNTTLPSDTWLSEFNLQFETLQLMGTTRRDPIELITLLEGLNWISNVTLDRRFETDRTSGLSQFDLSISLMLDKI